MKANRLSENDVYNFFKLILLMTALVAFYVLGLMLRPSGAYEILYIYPQIPLYCSHIAIALIMTVAGYIGFSAYFEKCRREESNR